MKTIGFLLVIIIAASVNVLALSLKSEKHQELMKQGEKLVVMYNWENNSGKRIELTYRTSTGVFIYIENQYKQGVAYRNSVDFYKSVLADEYENEVVDLIINELKKTANSKKELIDNIFSFVSVGISFDTNSYNLNLETKEQITRLPSQTIADGCGLENDKALLLYMMLAKVDLAVAMFSFDGDDLGKNLYVGVKYSIKKETDPENQLSFDKTGYALLETRTQSDLQQTGSVYPDKAKNDYKIIFKSTGNGTLGLN